MMYTGNIEFTVTDTLTSVVKIKGLAPERAAAILRSPAVRYPLHCVSRDDATATEDQYAGPFDSHDAAHEQLRDRSDVVRRCRQLRPSEVVVDHVDLIGLPLSELINTLDECATSGDLPEAAWCFWDQQVVFVDGDDGTLPTAENYVEWVDTHLRVEAYICEGDE